MKNNIIRYLGVDWGEKRIGLAIGDSDSKMAVPYKTVINIKDVLEIIKEENINIVVIGEPIKMSGKKNFPNKFLKFVKKIKNNKNIKIKLVDERLTSKHADSLFGDKKNKASRDAISAMLILDGYFKNKKLNFF